MGTWPSQRPNAQPTIQAGQEGRWFRSRRRIFDYKTASRPDFLRAKATSAPASSWAGRPRPYDIVPAVPRIAMRIRLPLGDRLRQLALAILRWALPPRVVPPAELLEVLRTIYPRLDLARVNFRLGMPHLLSLGPYHAITLPETFGVRRIGIHVRCESFRTDSVEDLGILVHEAFHALQIQEALGGWGIGLVRPFPVLYLACAAANRFLYEGHPIETDAYVHAGRRASRFEKHCRACSGGEEHPPDPASLFGVAELVVEASGLAFWRKAWASAGLAWFGRAVSSLRCGWQTTGLRPAVVLGFVLLSPLAALGALWLAIWLAVWAGATAILWVLQVLVVALAAGVAGVLFAMGTLLRLAGSRRRPVD